MPQPQQAGPDLANAVTARQAEAMEPAALVQLSELEAACRQCQHCGLADSRRQVVVGRGNPAARLLLIGEAPGAEEDASGQPFVGRAGRLLEQLLAEAGLDSERDLFIANVIKCRPPGNRKPSRAEIAACRPWLERQLALQKPALIALVGATALEAMLGIKGGITKLRGEWLEPLEGSGLSLAQAPSSAEVAPQQPTQSSAISAATLPSAPPSIQSTTRSTAQPQQPPGPAHGPADLPNDLPNHLANQPSHDAVTINQQTISQQTIDVQSIKPQSIKPQTINPQSFNPQSSNPQTIALMPLLHPSYLLRNPSDQEGSPKWHTLQDLKQLRRRLDELLAGRG